MTALYELTTEYQLLLDIASSIPDADREYQDDIEGRLSSLMGSIGDKTESICKVITMLEADADNLDHEARRMKVREERRRNNAKRLREYLKINIEAMGQKKVEGLLFTASVRKSPMSCEVTDETLVPVDWMIQPPMPAPRVDKAGIIDAFKRDGEMIPGTVVKQGTYLKIG